MDGALLHDNLSFLSLFARALVLFDRIETFHYDSIVAHANNLPIFFTVFADQHYYFVAFFDVHTISCAKLAIVLNPRSLISLGIGPKMRPPFGSVPSSSTSAFSSNLI